MRTFAQRALWIPVVVGLVACGGGAKNQPMVADPATASTTEPGQDHDGGAAESTDTGSDGIPQSLVLLQGSEDGARAYLKKFLEPNADYGALTSSLRPTTSDYQAMFDPPTAAKVEAGQAKGWDSLRAVVKPKAGQTEIKLWSATGTELAKGSGPSKDFPSEYKKFGKHLEPSLIFFRFKFVEPGKDLGTTYDGLVFVNGHWVIAPKPWRAVEGKGFSFEDETQPAAGPSKPKPKGKGKKH